MDGLGDVIGAAGAAAGGGVFGILGSAVNRVFGIFERREARRDREQQYAEQVNVRAHELELLRENRLTAAAETENEIAVTQTEGSFRGLEASLTAAASIGNAPGWVNAVRAMVRPILTILLWVFAALIFKWVLESAAGGVLSADEIPTLVRYVVYSVIFAATTATVWWYGDRAPRPPLSRR